MYFSSNLSFLRKEKGLTQEAVAETLDLGRQAVGFYESGDREPTLENLLNLARFFEVSVDDLLSKDMRPAGSLLSFNIRYLRKSNRITQKELARLLGAEDPAVSKYESDHAKTGSKT